MIAVHLWKANAGGEPSILTIENWYDAKLIQRAQPIEVDAGVNFHMHQHNVFYANTLTGINKMHAHKDINMFTKTCNYNSRVNWSLFQINQTNFLYLSNLSIWGRMWYKVNFAMEYCTFWIQSLRSPRQVGWLGWIQWAGF